jgi:hypothetical protein
VGGVPGTRHVVWQVAACELHPIMHLVTAEVCARRILAAACTAEWHGAMANPAATNKRVIAPQRMMRFLSPRIIAPGEGRGNITGAVPDRLSGEDIVAHGCRIALHLLEAMLDDVANRDDAREPALIDHG